MVRKMFISLLVFVILPITKVSASSVVINEFMPHPSSGNEWIELYNPTSTTVDLTDWKLKDANSVTYDDLTLSGTIAPAQFVVFENTRSWLNDSKAETITLVDNNLNQIDSYTYTETTVGKTYGRQPDGETWVANLNPTYNQSNGGTASTSSPSPTISPTSAPSTSPTPPPSPSPTISISQVPTLIDVSQQFTVHVTLTNFPASTNIYLKGAFKKAGSANYFGMTLVNGSWIKNYQTRTSQLSITSDQSGNYSGNMTVKVDPDDSGFEGEGNYIFKVGYYLDPSVTWSQDNSIHLSGVKQNENQTRQDTTSTVAIPSPSKFTNAQVIQSKVKLTLPQALLGTSSASLSALISATPSSSPEKTAGFKKERVVLLALGIILIISGGIIFSYAKFYHYFRR